MEKKGDSDCSSKDSTPDQAAAAKKTPNFENEQYASDSSSDHESDWLPLSSEESDLSDNGITTRSKGAEPKKSKNNTKKHTKCKVKISMKTCKKKLGFEPEDEKECKRQSRVLYQREWRNKLSGTARERHNETSRLRMRKLREKQKKIPQSQKSASEQKRLRKIWADQKRHQREKLTPEMKAKNDHEKMIKTLSKLTASEFIKVVQLSATPTKKLCMSTKGYILSPNSAKQNKLNSSIATGVKKAIHKLKQKRNDDSRKKACFIRSFLANCKRSQYIRRQMNIKWESWQKSSEMDSDADLEDHVLRKRRSDALEPELTEQIEACYEEHSTPLPLKRMANKAVMNVTMKRACKNFNENSLKTVSLSSFQRLRPKQVLTVDKAKFVGCVCERCLNMDYKVRKSKIRII
jgi:hypothetical protein